MSASTLTLTLHNRQQAWDAIKTQVFPFLAKVLQAGARWVLTIKLETRSQEQNRLMWPLLTVFSQPLGDAYHLDHKMPLALGGTNTDDNMQLLRQRCNNQKGAKHPVDFMQSRGFLL